MVAIYMVVTLLALLAMSVIVASIVESFMVTQRTESQISETQRMALEIGPEMDELSAEELYSYVLTKAQSIGGRVLVLDTDAVVQVDSASIQNGYRLPYREVRDVLLLGMETAHGFHKIPTVSADASEWEQRNNYTWAVYYTAPITQDGIYRGVVLFATSLQDVQDSVNLVVRQIAIVLIIVALVMAIVSYVLSNVVAKPIIELTNAIRRMGKRGQGVRVKVNASGGSEVEELGHAFNRMSEQIEDHDRVRDEFVSNASHELKTPLASMKLLSESLLYQDDPDPAMMKEFLNDINNEVDRLSNIITDLLRLVQFDETEQDIIMRPLELDALLERIVLRLKPLAQSKGVEIMLKTEELSIIGDSMRIEQAMTNLVENSIKYTDAGSVHVEAYAADDEAVITVEDTGIGIPEDSIPHLFERFYRVDKARSRDTGGTGLGLSIVERTVYLHDGRIEVASEYGKGSKFTVYLPLQPGESI